MTTDMLQQDATAVVTAYRAGDSLASLVDALLPQVGEVVVVDDGSGPDASGVLDRCERIGARVLRLEVNSGIAAALNAGVAAALTRSPAPEYVVTFDQDSAVPPGYVRALAEAERQATSVGIRVGMVAPESVQGLPSRVRGTRRNVVLGGEPIQSGLLVPTSVIGEIGTFMESLFIDAVDTEFYLRARAAGFEAVVAAGTALGHALGDRYYPRVFGRRIRIAGRDLGLVRSAPFRYYYIARNHVTMLRLFGRAHPGWAARETLLDLRHFGILLVFVPGRLRHCRLLIAGYADGIRGKSGRIPPNLA